MTLHIYQELEQIGKTCVWCFEYNSKSELKDLKKLFDWREKISFKIS